MNNINNIKKTIKELTKQQAVVLSNENFDVFKLNTINKQIYCLTQQLQVIKQKQKEIEKDNFLAKKFEHNAELLEALMK